MSRALPNVAKVELDGSDGIKITLLGRAPIGFPQVHEFKGKGLKQINKIMVGMGVDVVAWLIDDMLWPSGEDTDLPIVLKAPQAKVTPEQVARAMCVQLGLDPDGDGGGISPRWKAWRSDAERFLAVLGRLQA